MMYWTEHTEKWTIHR